MSSTEIINRALIKIGQPPIASNTQAPYGETSGILYEDLRDFLLSSYYWRFAINDAVLARDEQELSGEYRYSYTLPSDFLTLVQVGIYYKQPNLSDFIMKSDARYSLQGNKILTDIPDKLFIKYVFREEDETKYSRCFREALICKLAAELAPRVKQSAAIKQQCDQEFQQIMAVAQTNNEIQRDIETIPDGSWVTCRGVWANEY